MARKDEKGAVSVNTEKVKKKGEGFPVVAGRMSVRLNFPVLWDDEEYTVLNLPQRVKLRDLKETDCEKGDVGKAVALIATLAKWPIMQAEMIDAADIQPGTELGDYVARFLEVAPRTGKK